MEGRRCYSTSIQVPQTVRNSSLNPQRQNLSLPNVLLIQNASKQAGKQATKTTRSTPTTHTNPPSYIYPPSPPHRPPSTDPLTITCSPLPPYVILTHARPTPLYPLPYKCPQLPYRNALIAPHPRPRAQSGRFFSPCVMSMPPGPTGRRIARAQNIVVCWLHALVVGAGAGAGAVVCGSDVPTRFPFPRAGIHGMLGSYWGSATGHRLVAASHQRQRAVMFMDVCM